MSDTTDLKPRAYTVQSFERLFGVGHTKTYELINKGKLRTTKIGRRTLILAGLGGRADQRLDEGGLDAARSRATAQTRTTRRARAGRISKHRKEPFE